MDQIMVDKIVIKTGESNGRAWTRYGVKDANGEWYSTFDEGLVAKLTEGAAARIQYETKMINGRAVKNLVAVEDGPGPENGAMPKAYSKQLPDGGANWDKKDLEIARQAIWKSFLEGLAANLYAKVVSDNQKADPDRQRDPIDYVLITGARVVVAAERDIFERQPGDDAIPFEAGQ